MQRALEGRQRLRHLRHAELIHRNPVRQQHRHRVARIAPKPREQLGRIAQPVLDSVQQRIERLILEPRLPAVPEQAALPPDVEQARRIARPVLAGDPRRMRQPVGVCTLRLVAGRARHLTVRAERTVEEQHAAERGDRRDPRRLPLLAGLRAAANREQHGDRGEEGPHCR